MIIKPYKTSKSIMFVYKAIQADEGYEGGYVK